MFIIYDTKFHVVHNTLSLHSYATHIHGSKLQNEMRVRVAFKKTPENFKYDCGAWTPHLKEKEHNKAFYRLCLNMLENYHEMELDMRLFLIQLERENSIYA